MDSGATDMIDEYSERGRTRPSAALPRLATHTGPPEGLSIDFVPIKTASEIMAGRYHVVGLPLGDGRPPEEAGADERPRADGNEASMRP